MSLIHGLLFPLSSASYRQDFGSIVIDINTVIVITLSFILDLYVTFLPGLSVQGSLQFDEVHLRELTISDDSILLNSSSIKKQTKQLTIKKE